MPALRWFGRRWRTGTDDFTWSSVYGAASCLVAGIFAITRFDPTDDPSSPLSFSVCPGATETFRTSLYAEGVVSLIAAGVCLALAVASARGRIFDTSKRAVVPILLYFAAVTFLVLLILNCIVTHQALTRDELHLCSASRDTALVTLIIALNFVSTLGFGLVMMLSFDPSGSRTFHSEEEYHSLWVERCSLMCCCYRDHSSGQEAFSEAARTMASLFRAFDIVPSDIAAGMLVLHGYQSYQRKQRRVRTFEDTKGSHPTASNAASQHGGPEQSLRSAKTLSLPLNPGEALSSQARPIPPLTDDQRARLDRIHYFSKYYLGAYGWMLYTFMHLVTGIPRLLAADMTMCCRSKRHNGIEFHESCGCDTTALKKVTGLTNDDILLTSFENTIYRPCFYVALDRPSNTVVIAVRGTMSLEDCITDMVATPGEIVLDSQPPEDGHSSAADDTPQRSFTPSSANQESGSSGGDATNETRTKKNVGHVHSGMLQSATNILQVLVKEQVLHDLIHGHHAGCKLVVLGHSLGAGTAAVLSLLLWAKWPPLRERMHCIAYSPPGGLMSEVVQQHTAPFMTACFVGHDVIPRASQQNFDLLRDNLLAVLAHTSTPKAAVFCYFCCPQQLGAKLPPSLELDAKGHFVSSPESRVPLTDVGTPLQSKEMTSLRRLGASAVSPTATSTNSRFPATSSPPVLLVPPSVIAQYVKMVTVPNRCCGRREIHCPVFVSTTELDHVICHPTMTWDHFPDRVFAVINETHRAMEAGELYRFTGNAQEAQDAHDQFSKKVMSEHSMVFVSAATAAVAIHQQQLSPLPPAVTLGSSNNNSSSAVRVQTPPNAV